MIGVASSLSLAMSSVIVGPSSVGKSETVLLLGRILGRRTHQLSMPASFDIQGIGRMCKAMAACGLILLVEHLELAPLPALSVLSAAARCIHAAVVDGSIDAPIRWLDGKDLILHPTRALVATFSSSRFQDDEPKHTYLGTAFRAYFRPTAMAEPDIRLFAEYRLKSVGCHNARELSAKLQCLFQLCSSQLTPCDHYSFDAAELMALLSRWSIAHIQNANAVTNFEPTIIQLLLVEIMPKLKSEDVALFDSFLHQLFPDSVAADTRDSRQFDSINAAAHELGYYCHSPWLLKTVELSQLAVTHRVLMLVGCAGIDNQNVYL